MDSCSKDPESHNIDSLEASNEAGDGDAKGTNRHEPTLKLLPKSTVRLIASAQVITSVYSVVKELLENAVDAGATSVDLKLENYGFDKIEVRDNGSGVPLGDVALMAQPHYTSKMTSEQDLQRLATYGFRGEALGSLCTVADVAITTKTKDDDISMTYTMDHKGHVTDRKASHLGQGTTVTACHLFKSLPVRKQYYGSIKRRREELKRVEDLFLAYGLACPGTRLCLRHNRDLVWQKSPTRDVRSSVLAVLSSTITNSMLSVDKDCLDPKCTVKAYLGKPGTGHVTSRATSDRCFVVVNNRPVIIKDIEKLLKKYYTEAVGMEANRHPVAYVSLTLARDAVDVNVDPNKTKVLVQDKEALLAFLTSVLDDAYVTTRNAGADGKRQTDVDPVLTHDPPAKGSDDMGAVAGTTSGVGSRSHEARPDPGDRRAAAASDDALLAVSAGRGDGTTMGTPERRGVGGGVSVAAARLFKAVQDDDDDEDDDDSFAFLNFSTPEGLPRASDQHAPPVGGLRASTAPAPGNPSGQHHPQHHERKEALAHTAMALTGGLPGQADSSPDGATLPGQGQGQSVLDISAIATEMSSAPESWSRGTSLVDQAGNRVQPVSLHVPGPPCPPVEPALAAPGPTCSTPASSKAGIGLLGFTPVPSTPLTQRKLSLSKRKLAANSPGQASLYDLVGGCPIKRPSTAYITFSREARHQVVAQHPDWSLQRVAQTIADRWEVLSEEERQQYSAASRDSSRRSERPPTTSSPYPSNRKRKSEAGDITSNLATPASAKRRKSDIPLKDVPFDIERLKVTYLNSTTTASQLWTSERESRSLIGHVPDHDVWVCRHDNQLMLFDPVRAQEELIYQCLMGSHVLRTDPLTNPIVLSPKYVGDFALWGILLALPKCTTGLPDPGTRITSELVVNNGIAIRQTQVGDSARLEVVAASPVLGGYVVTALQHILRAIHAAPEAMLRDVRPPCVRRHLQGEAVRMARGLPQCRSRSDVKEVMSRVERQLLGGSRACSHQRPFLHPLYNLQELVTSSQDSTLSQFTQSLCPV